MGKILRTQGSLMFREVGKCPGKITLELSLFFFSFKILFIYLRETGRENKAGVGDEADSQSSRDPNAGLDLRTPGSHSEPKADAQPLSHPGAPGTEF